MTLIKYLKANRSAAFYMLIWQAVFLILGGAMVLGINGYLNEEADYACIGSVFALAATLIGVFARNNLNGLSRFSLAIAMGQTRRSYLLCDPLVSLLIGALGVTVAWCVYQVEDGLYAFLYPGFTNDMPLDGFYQLKYILPALIAVVLLEMIFSAVTLRFGRKVFSLFWLCYCFSFMIIPRSVDAYENGGTSLFARIGGVIVVIAKALPINAWIGVGAVILLALLVLSINVFRKAEAKL